MPRRDLVDTDACEGVSTALRRVRENFKFSRYEMAEAIFVSPSSIRNLENNMCVTKTLCHHLWLAYSDYFYDCMQDLNDRSSITNPADVERDLRYVETVLYGDKEDQ